MQHLLLAVSGMTPQIITETLYGIYCKTPQKMPTAIKVITTSDGKDRLCNTLMGPDGHLQKFCQDYGLPLIPFSVDDVLVPAGDDGKLLEDVRSEREQAILGDFITGIVRTFCNDGQLAVHASLAGGRKTMGFSLGYAMSLFGRPQDCLTHVLVSAPYEEVPDFYYPTPATVMRTDRNKNRHYDLSRAQVTLAEIPLVLMREEMPTDLMRRQDLSYTETIERVNQALQLNQNTASIKLDYDHLTVICNERPVVMKPDCFAFYSFIAHDTVAYPEEGMEPPLEGMSMANIQQWLQQWANSLLPPALRAQAGDNAESVIDTVDDYLSRMPDVSTPASLLKNTSDNGILIAGDADAANLCKKLKHLWDRLLRETNDQLKDALGQRLAEHYQIKTVSKLRISGGKRPLECKGLMLLPEHIDL